MLVIVPLPIVVGAQLTPVCYDSMFVMGIYMYVHVLYTSFHIAFIYTRYSIHLILHNYTYTMYMYNIIIILCIYLLATINTCSFSDKEFCSFKGLTADIAAEHERCQMTHL